MFVVLSLLYGKLVIVACIAFVVSNEISSKSLPKQYYEVNDFQYYYYLYNEASIKLENLKTDQLEYFGQPNYTKIEIKTFSSKLEAHLRANSCFVFCLHIIGANL